MTLRIVGWAIAAIGDVGVVAEDYVTALERVRKVDELPMRVAAGVKRTNALVTDRHEDVRTVCLGLITCRLQCGCGVGDLDGAEAAREDQGLGILVGVADHRNLDL